jgi:trehalose 6-phosphate phosphatase
MGPTSITTRIWAPTGGASTATPTSVMVVWLMHRALDTLAVLHGYHCDELVSALTVDPPEVERWTDITSKMFVPFHGRDQPSKATRT